MASNTVNQDFALSGNDLVIIDGDFAIGESDVQHVADMLNAFPGWWKEFPQYGVGLMQYFNGDADPQTIKKNAKIMLSADGYNVDNMTVTIVDGLLTINPNATR
jgi:hypothetical protein